MTSKPGLGQRQPQQRASNGSAMQRPPVQRGLSQHTFSSTSPSSRRGNDSLAEAVPENSDALRHGPRYGSRLKLEISKDAQHPALVAPPQPIFDEIPTSRLPLPPRGRPQFHSGISDVEIADGWSPKEIPRKPVPLPVRPGQHAQAGHEREATPMARTSSIKKDMRPKPYVLETPAAAPRFPPGHADFFPWIGSHAEDQFSESVIRQGFYDKTQMSQNETGAAKTSIFPALKHKSGLQTLSSLLTSILSERRAHGQITSNTSFKPPPRVTVTDTKREMWLKDLANPTIPLRRLSRSIPHGIRGKILLEQSLGKNIPTDRAVWLAKCVGANELRSFRRKGVSGTFSMGGEAKWVRDFTICVEQFIESIIGPCGESHFKTRLNYAVRLATHFYAEYLLDREHYLDWLVSSLENSSEARLPVWLLLSRIYWKDVLKYRKFGRRLSSALSFHFSECLSHPDLDVMAPLITRLEQYLSEVILSNPENFVTPKFWAKYRNVITSRLASTNDGLSSRIADIDRRNTRMNGPRKGKEPGPRQRLTDLLDTTLSQPCTKDFPDLCWQIDGDKTMLINTVLEWSSSCYRPGIIKVYVGTRLMRSWSKNSADITDSVISFLDTRACELGRDKAAFYLLVSELARSEHFSVPTYLRWLVARGGLREPAELARDGPCATRLLAELPTHILNDATSGLRRTLLDRVQFSIDEEQQQTIACISMMDRSLRGKQSRKHPKMEGQDPAQIVNQVSRLSRSSKSNVGLWLREKVRLQMAGPKTSSVEDWHTLTMRSKILGMSKYEFSMVRQYLELVGDYSMLADVLKVLANSSDVEVLASCGDTLDLHLETFAAIGALSSIFDILLARLRAMIDEVDCLPRVFLVSLLGLSERIPENEVVSRQISQETTLVDRKTAADACSPVSDHMAGNLHNNESDFTDEIEKIFASGNSMDQSTLGRLFGRITLYLESSWHTSPDQQRSGNLLLARLRAFDGQYFDKLITAWIRSLLLKECRPSMNEMLGPLISSGCLALEGILMALFGSQEAEMTEVYDVYRVAKEVLALLVAPIDHGGAVTADEVYRLRVKQAQVRKDHFVEVLSAVRFAFGALASSRGNDSGALSEIDALFNTSSVPELLQTLVLTDADEFCQSFLIPLLRNGTSGASLASKTIVDKLLAPQSELEGARELPMDAVLDLANELTLRFCQIKLTSVLGSFAFNDACQDLPPTEHLETLDKVLESAVTAENTAWTCIIPLLNPSILKHLYRRAETQFLALFPVPNAPTRDGDCQPDLIKARKLLCIIESTAHDTTITDPASFSSSAATLLECVSKLNHLWLLISGSRSSESQSIISTKWLPLLLTFLTTRIAALEVTKAGHEPRVKVLLALTALLLEMQASHNEADTLDGIIEQTFDLALLVADTLPDDLRQHSLRRLRDKASHAHIRYIYSFSQNPSEWLVLSQKDRISNDVGMDGGGTSSDKQTMNVFHLKRWEMLGEPTPNIGENDTSLSLTLFGARRG